MLGRHVQHGVSRLTQEGAVAVAQQILGLVAGGHLDVVVAAPAHAFHAVQGPHPGLRFARDGAQHVQPVEGMHQGPGLDDDLLVLPAR